MIVFINTRDRTFNIVLLVYPPFIAVGTSTSAYGLFMLPTSPLQNLAQASHPCIVFNFCLYITAFDNVLSTLPLRFVFTHITFNTTSSLVWCPLLFTIRNNVFIIHKPLLSQKAYLSSILWSGTSSTILSLNALHLLTSWYSIDPFHLSWFSSISRHILLTGFLS